MEIKKIYEEINFTPRLITPKPIIYFIDDGDIRTWELVEKLFLWIIDWKKYKLNMIYTYDNIDMYWNVCYFDDDTGYSSDSKFVKNNLLYTKISEDKDVISVHNWKFYVKEVKIADFKNILNYDWEKFNNCYDEIMFSMHFYLHINEKIIMYWHIDYWFWFIDITWKNWELMKELLKDFVKIKGLTWYANKLWKKYVSENKIDIKLEKED